MNEIEVMDDSAAGTPSPQIPAGEAPGTENALSSTPPGYGEILRFALPLALGMMTSAVNTLVDAMFIGRLGTAQLAAVPLAGFIYLVGWVLLVGVMRNSIAFTARAHGAGKSREIGPILTQYHLLALAGLPLMLLYIQAWPAFAAMGGLSVRVDAFAWDYLSIRAWDIPFSMGVWLYAAFYQGIGNSRFPMLVNAGVVGLNIALDYGLIFGHWGLPAMGVQGSALATVIAQAVGAVAIFCVAHLGVSRARYGLRLWERPRASTLWDILRIGIPQGVGDCVELATWSGFMLIVGRMGEVSLAASNIGIQMTHLLFLPGFALGIAASSYMGRFLGAGHPLAARRTALRILRVGVVYMGLAGIPLWFFGESIARGFTSDPEVVRLAGLMFKVMAVYQVFDALGLITRTALGGAGDTKAPTLALIACSLLVMFPAAWGLSRLVTPPMLGAWLGAFAYMLVYAAAMQWRFHGGRWMTIRIGAGLE